MQDNTRSKTWLWVAIPFALVIIAVVAFIMLTDPTQAGPFDYGQ